MDHTYTPTHLLNDLFKTSIHIDIYIYIHIYIYIAVAPSQAQQPQPMQQDLEEFLESLVPGDEPESLERRRKAAEHLHSWSSKKAKMQDPATSSGASQPQPQQGAQQPSGPRGGPC